MRQNASVDPGNPLRQEVRLNVLVCLTDLHGWGEKKMDKKVATVLLRGPSSRFRPASDGWELKREGGGGNGKGGWWLVGRGGRRRRRRGEGLLQLEIAPVSRPRQRHRQWRDEERMEKGGREKEGGLEGRR